ncbi:hypothetical protein KSF78_0009153 [Schistosoma japonicum]|nr:hypothetical protein KSF78_0009153 [Schistosoma japonicum]
MSGNEVENIRSTNINNEKTDYNKEFNHFKQYNHSNISTLTISNYNNDDRKSNNLTEQLLFEVMNENSVLREKNEELREMIYHEEDNSKPYPGSRTWSLQIF